MPDLHRQAHDKNGEFVKAAVFGGLDGIITTFAVVASVAGADLQVRLLSHTSGLPASPSPRPVF